ncbi:MAG: PmoA family protein [Draconibacterium sp.]
MKKSVLYFLLVIFVIVSCTSKKESGKPKITFNENDTEEKIDVLAGDNLFTSFRWTDNMTKPVFYPIITSEGTSITRGFPIDPKAGERADHPHQIGMWFTYGNVNGLDFWGNGSQGLGTKNRNGGFIKHQKIEDVKEGAGEGSFTSEESWQDSTGTELMHEKTAFRFIADGKMRIIDRTTTFTAGETDILMSDTKEGMFGLRVARQLELPDNGNLVLYNNDGTITRTRDTLNIGITGDYISSEGITGLDVWGTRARWMDLHGKIGDENISIIICDHPSNPNYPTYWHARGYGLFAANPLGVKDFTKDAETFNFSIPAGKSATFRYRVIINSGELLTKDKINKLADEFALTK